MKQRDDLRFKILLKALRDAVDALNEATEQEEGEDEDLSDFAKSLKNDPSPAAIYAFDITRARRRLPR